MARLEQEFLWAACSQAEAFMSDKTYNSRFQRYAAIHGRSPIKQLAYDEQRWPGGRMVGYILWMSAAWQAFDVANAITGAMDTRRMKRYDAARRAGFVDESSMFDRFLATYRGQLDADGKVIECRS